MKKYIIIIILLWQSICIVAQVSDGGLPLSYSNRFLKSNVSIPGYKLKTMNFEKLMEEDTQNNIDNRYSVFDEVSIDLKNGYCISYPNEGGRIWQFKIVSGQAYSIQVIFSKFYIPQGANLFIYNEDYSIIFGAFTEKNNRSDSVFVVGDFMAKNIIVEYFEPDNAPFKGKVVIGSIGQAYIDIYNEALNTGSFIDINCNEGLDWQTEKHSVCKITFKDGLSGYLCTGSLINNAKNDGMPYFLTASHCIDDQEKASTVIVYFNYEKTICNGIISKGNTISGTTFLTREGASDFSLLKLSKTPPVTYLPYYSGWDVTSAIPLEGTSIHHPQGIEKKISKDFDVIATYPYSMWWDEGESSLPNTHWESILDLGPVAGGSSGAPLFDSNRRIIGQLHGGSDDQQYFGKLSYSYAHAETGLQKLKSYLDPENTGIKYLNGYAPTGIMPDAYFAADYTSVCTGAPIKFTDYTSFNPVSWKWVFSPSTVTYTSGTSSTSKNPVVIFNEDGAYNVTLKATNINGYDEITFNSYIQAGNELQLEVIRPVKTGGCLYNFDSLYIKATGASNYNWTLTNRSDSLFELYNLTENEAIIKFKPTLGIDTSIYINVLIEGEHGVCSQSVKYLYKLMKQANDDITNAIPVELGENGEYSNLCATIETNEPVPPYDSCTAQGSWCDEYGTGKNIVENSVWFYFYGSETGIVGLRSSGFDNQVAIYQANSYQDILNGFYTIIGANDDYTENNANPIIVEVGVTPLQKYWVQVDGSGGGSEGNFYLYLYDHPVAVSIEDCIQRELKIYPQPVSNILTVESDDLVSSSSVLFDICFNFLKT